MLGVVENMCGIQRPVDALQFIAADGKDDTAAVLQLLQQKAPELLQYSVQTHVFPTAAGGGEAMAKAFDVPFLGRLPLDERMTRACEEAVSFLEEYPTSSAAPAFGNIVDQIVQRVDQGGQRHH